MGTQTAQTPAARPLSETRHERELRLAVVCYGGVSLAVYMHGITKEILKLARASRDLHRLRGDAERDSAGYGLSSRPDSFADTEYVYFDLLRDIGRVVDLRVVIDIIAGASAGGINAIMLARALAYDLSLEAHRDLWLNLADVTELLDPLGRAGLWSKPYMRPALWLIGVWQRRKAAKLGIGGGNPEVLRKLSLFTRSRWFHPPFSGTRMSEMMLDGALSIGVPESQTQSLLPPGLPLDLFVTTTDFWGHRQAIALHDPPLIQEREHRHILRFTHVRRANGEVISNFGIDHAPSLAFAARATSCFPGAFPPARFAEMDKVVAARGMEWVGREAFLTGSFASLYAAGEDPEEAAFIDGSVLMNKPISLAIEAVQGRAAHREVDRRLVYIEPNPETARAFVKEVPGFFKTLKGALSDIPRNQPIRDDLEWLAEFNQHVRTRRQVVDAVKPNVMKMIAELLGERLDTPPDIDTLIAWRHAANERAAHDAAYAYDGYARLKVMAVLKDVGAMLKILAGIEDQAVIDGHVRAWVRRTGIRPLGDTAEEAQLGDIVAWIAFLRNFDARYRLRRLRFIIRRLNELYRVGDQPCSPAGRQWLNRLKSQLYGQIDMVQQRMEWSGMEPLLSGSSSMFCGEAGELGAATIDNLFECAATSMDLAKVDDALDHLLAEHAAGCPEVALWRELVIAYLGFSYYDVLTYPMTQWRDLDELDEVKVDRISVNDANTLREGNARQILKGVELGNFGAFFSRSFRENDYLWGRLTGAERLVDIIVSAAPEAVAAGVIDARMVKKKLFLAILKSESAHLGEIPGIIAELIADAERL